MTSWVLGSGGLLGSAVAGELRGRGETLVEAGSIGWSEPDALTQLARAAAAVSDGLEPASLAIYWCAGVGTMAADEADMRREAEAVSTLLDFVRTDALASIFIASSAGGVWAGAGGVAVDEESAPVPINAYGRGKLAIEQIVHDFSTDAGVASVAGRITNIYGAAQNPLKSQGLLSAIARAYAGGRPVQIRVPVSTRRDYLDVRDAARVIVATDGLQRAVGGSGVKLVCSGRSSSIADVLAAFERVTGAPVPGDVDMSTPDGVADPRFVSVRFPETQELVLIDLDDGVRHLLEAAGGVTP